MIFARVLLSTRHIASIFFYLTDPSQTSKKQGIERNVG